jgi:hypothetical protein
MPHKASPETAPPKCRVNRNGDLRSRVGRVRLGQPDQAPAGVESADQDHAGRVELVCIRSDHLIRSVAEKAGLAI